MNISAHGENKFIVRGFKNRQALMNHWKDHGEQYPNDGILHYEIRKKEDIENGGSE